MKGEGALGERALAGGAALVLVSILLFATSFGSAAPEMDEGTLVAYPQLVSDGLVPGKDFETFYGPGEPYFVAAASAVAGHSVEVERAFGLVLRLLLIISAFMLGLRWGIVAALAAGATSLLVMLSLGVSALAIFGAAAFGLLAMALLTRQPDPRRGTARRTLPSVLAGVAAGIAVAYRPDVAPALALGAVPFLIWTHGGRRPFLIAFGAALVPTLIWAVVVGPDDLSRLFEDLTASRSGRHLPLPGLGSANGQVLVCGALAAVAAIGTGFARRHAEGRENAALALLSLGLFSIGLLPSAIQRADDAHVLPFACVALAAVPLLVAEALDGRRARNAAGPRTAAIVAAGALAVLTAGAVAHAAGPTVRDRVLSGDDAPEVRVADRTYPVASQEAADDLNRLLPKLAEMSSEGETLFAGPADLRRTNYADTFLYFMLPALRPASFFTEVNPQTANAEDSGLADELREADWLILTTRYDDFVEESNDSVEFGSDEPNQVVEEEFKPVAESGTYTLYRRRD